MAKTFNIGGIIGANKLEKLKAKAGETKRLSAEQRLPVEVTPASKGMSIADGRRALAEAVMRHYDLPKPELQKD